MELISVIMSVYNEKREWLEISLNSILDQSYKNIEFIVVMDNPDNEELKKLLCEYIEKDHRIKLITNPENFGLVRSLNLALRQANGEYIARMDADDVSILDRLTLQKEYLERNNLDFVFSGMNYINENGEQLYSTESNELDSRKVKKILEIINISNHPTWFMRRQVNDCLQGYRSLSHCEDYDFTLRALNENFKIGKMDKNVVNYRVRSNSISHKYKFEQHLNAVGISKLYRKGCIGNNNELNILIETSRKISISQKKYKYEKFNIVYTTAMEKAKKGERLKALILFLNCFFLSKYHTNYFLKIVKYKIIQNKK